MFLDGLGRVCFLRKLTRSTTAVPLMAFTRRTFPFLPRSRPERTTTVSPFLTCGLAGRGVSFCFAILPYMTGVPQLLPSAFRLPASLNDFRGERNDLHEL